MNYFEYVSSSDKTFEEKTFNEVDNLVLSCLTYLDFTGIVPNKKVEVSLKTAGEIYLETYKKREIAKLGIAQKDAYKLLQLAIKSPRFKNIMLSNYRYITSLDSQFSAMTFKITKKLKFIGFEGTDELLSGWKEDAYLSFRFPVDAQEYAINYLNEVVSFFDSNIILGGITGVIINSLSLLRNILTSIGKLNNIFKYGILLLIVILTIIFNNLGFIGYLPLIGTVIFTIFIDSKDRFKFKMSLTF